MLAHPPKSPAVATLMLLAVAVFATGRAAAGEQSFRLELVPDRPYVVGDVSTSLQVRVVDADGQTTGRFDGTRPQVDGLAERAADGRLVPLRSGPPLVEGRAVLHGVVVADVVNVRVGDLQAQWRPRRVPGWWSIVPPGAAILLALLTRQVLLALFAGIYLGVLVVEAWQPHVAFVRTLDRHLLETVADSGHAAVLCSPRRWAA